MLLILLDAISRGNLREELVIRGCQDPFEVLAEFRSGVLQRRKRNRCFLSRLRSQDRLSQKPDQLANRASATADCFGHDRFIYEAGDFNSSANHFAKRVNAAAILA